MDCRFSAFGNIIGRGHYLNLERAYSLCDGLVDSKDSALDIELVTTGGSILCNVEFKAVRRLNRCAFIHIVPVVVGSADTGTLAFLAVGYGNACYFKRCALNDVKDAVDTCRAFVGDIEVYVGQIIFVTACGESKSSATKPAGRGGTFSCFLPCFYNCTYQ